MFGDTTECCATAPDNDFARTFRGRHRASARRRGRTGPAQPQPGSPREAPGWALHRHGHQHVHRRPVGLPASARRPLLLEGSGRARSCAKANSLDSAASAARGPRTGRVARRFARGRFPRPRLEQDDREVVGELREFGSVLAVLRFAGGQFLVDRDRALEGSPVRPRALLAPQQEPVVVERPGQFLSGGGPLGRRQRRQQVDRPAGSRRPPRRRCSARRMPRL